MLNADIEEIISSKSLKALESIRAKAILTDDEIRGVLQSLGQSALGVLKSKSPGKQFPQGWKMSANLTQTIFSLGITNSVIPSSSPLMHYLEEGTRPHVIRPKNRWALRFPYAGAIIFAKKVFHPGTKPYRMVKSALDFLDSKIKFFRDFVGARIREKLKITR